MKNTEPKKKKTPKKPSQKHIQSKVSTVLFKLNKATIQLKAHVYMKWHWQCLSLVTLFKNYTLV